MSVLTDLLQDLRFGGRALRRSPGFFALVVLSLGLGIGANAAMFGLADALFLRALPVRDPGALVFLTDPASDGVMDGLPQDRIELFSQRLYQRVRTSEQASRFDGIAAQDSSARRAFVGVGGPADDSAGDRAISRPVSANFFKVLGVPAFLGRTFGPEDERGAEPHPVVVLSHGYWQRHFGGDRNLLGARLHIGRQTFTVVGIAAPGFAGLEVGVPTDLWIPIADGPQPVLEFRQENRWLRVVGRLKPGVTPAAAQAGLDVVLQQYLAEDASLASDRPTRQRMHILLDPAATGASPLRESFRQPVLALMAGVAVLLLIVGLNVSHLLLARAIHRQREVQIRTALGASRARLIRQLLAEGLLLALLGGAAGVLFARWLSDALLALSAVPPTALPVRIDGRVLSFVALLVVAIALAMGLAPAWQTSHATVQPALRATAPAVTGRGRLGRILLSSQVAFSLVLLVGAALLAGSLGRLRAADKGFDEEGVLLVTLSGDLAELTPAQATSVDREILRRVTALPQVRSASLSALAPLGGGRITEAIVPAGATRGTLVRLTAVTPGYFETLGMKLVSGRTFTGADDAAAPRAAVVNEALARALFPDGQALGATFRFDPLLSPSQRPDSLRLVGVVRDARNTEMREPAEPMAYLAAAQGPPELLTNLQVRTATDPARLAETVAQVVRAAHPDLRVVNVRTMRTLVERLLVQERLLATLSVGFGLAALFLMSIGLFGVISQWAAQRTREIGVRIALGASRAGVRWMVLRQAFRMILAGVIVGAPAAVATTRLLRGLLYGLQPLDPRPLLLAALVLLAVAALAAYLPARRASRVDPMQALRAE